MTIVRTTKNDSRFQIQMLVLPWPITLSDPPHAIQDKDQQECQVTLGLQIDIRP
jgi:hypothetical protein